MKLNQIHYFSINFLSVIYADDGIGDEDCSDATFMSGSWIMATVYKTCNET